MFKVGGLAFDVYRTQEINLIIATPIVRDHLLLQHVT